MPADRQILAAGTIESPAAYTVPNAQELTLLAVNADYDGSGAAGNFIPAVVIVSDGGVVIARAADPSVVVTAGNDAEVSWFPGVTNAAGSVTPTTTRLPWCLAEADLPTDGTAPSYFFLDTPDASMYALNGASTAVLIQEPGYFAVKVSASLETNAFGAATVLDLDCSFTATLGVNYLQTIGSNGWASIGHALGGTPIWNEIQEFRVSNKAGNVHTLHVALNANPPGLDNADHYVTIERYDDPFPGGL